jgi:hypothetical protein
LTARPRLRLRWFSEKRIDWTSRVWMAALAIIAAVMVLVAASGCGLETEQANQDISRASQHQQEAEAILARLRNFTTEWEAIFNVPRIGLDQVNGARQLIQASGKDLDALEIALKKWEQDLRAIRSLNVDQKIGEYVKLKLDAITCYKDYVTGSLRPIFKAYEGLVELIAQGRPQATLDETAMEIAGLVTNSKDKLEQCQNAEKQADEYFKENKLGK